MSDVHASLYCLCGGAVILPKLQFSQAFVQGIALHEFIVRPDINDFPVIHNDNTVCF